ncbi:hypothetical protein HNW77_05525 [Komagataeibacter sp. AV436]|uniref:Uncharacterized protein n=1 Tax=Komagataeibacter melomenusus TaxID=2766578 RepID=A0ABX2ADE1_9PROT|nr:hypothetical protein [Komagataeibacter melomenusus]MBV1830301.1 hypothetical protein [Komagataeibacter melomenusus]NPC65857.1 hypothetical protein [Komagataeibacter melomenusus]
MSTAPCAVQTAPAHGPLQRDRGRPVIESIPAIGACARPLLRVGGVTWQVRAGSRPIILPV